MQHMEAQIPIYPLKRVYPDRHVFLYSQDELILSQCKQIKLLSSLKAKSTDTLISCGGVHSHHALAVAYECVRRNWECHLFLRGTPLKKPLGANLLLELLAPNIHYLSFESYRNEKEEKMEALAQKLSREGKHPLILPEGGSQLPTAPNPIALQCLQTVKQFEEKHSFQFDYLLFPLGTAGTYLHFLYANRKCKLTAKLVGIPALANPEYFKERWISFAENASDWEVWKTPKFRAFGKLDPTVAQMVQKIARLEGFVLDPLYDGKIVVTLSDKFQKGELQEKKILIWHTGGILDIFSMKWSFS